MKNMRWLWLVTGLSFFITCLSAQAERPYCIFVDGLVGAGKTTFINLLKKSLPNIHVVEEPAAQWLDVQGHGSLWDLYLQDQKRWAFSTEVYIPFIRIQVLENALAVAEAQGVILMDRSIYADRYCFARVAYENGSLSELEWAMYVKWFDWLAQHSPQPDGFIYVHVPAATTLKRMDERGRPEEKNFPLSLQQRFYECNQDFFIHKKELPSAVAAIPVLIIDGSQNFKDDPQTQAQCLAQVRQFLELIKKSN